MTRKPGPGLLAGVLLAAGVAAGGAADSIVAAVGEAVVLESELQQGVEYIRLMGDTVSTDSALRAQVLDQFIDNLVIEQQAERDTITVTREELESALDYALQRYRERYGSEEEFQAMLEAYGLTESQLRQQLKTGERSRALASKLMDKEGLTLASIYVSPAEVKRFYDENRDSIALVPGRVTLAHMLFTIAPSEAAEEDGQRRAAEVLDVLARGGDFRVVAGSFSDDAKTARKGGDWGWNDLGEIPLDLALVLNQLQPGQISPPFRSRDGYLIVRLDARSGDRVRFGTILIRVPLRRADTLRARNTAESVRNKVLGGMEFDSLARAFSKDPTTADSGGFLGEFLLEGLTPPFDSVVALLDSGEVSEPVLSEHGYHLVHVLEKEPERMMGYLEMQDMLRNYLRSQELNTRVERYVARIADKTYIKRYN